MMIAIIRLVASMCNVYDFQSIAWLQSRRPIKA